MMIYYNISHLINRIYSKKKKIINNSNIEKFLGNSYSFKSAIDSYGLYKLSNLLNLNLFNFMIDEISVDLKRLNISQNEQILTTYFNITKIDEITKKELINIFDICSQKRNNTYKINSLYLTEENQLYLGKIIQFTFYLQNKSLYDFSELNNIKINAIFEIFKRKTLNLNELIFWSNIIKVNLLVLLSIHFETTRNTP